MTDTHFPFLDHQGFESLDIDADVSLLKTLGMKLIRWGTHAVTGKRIALLHDDVASKIELIEVDIATGMLNHAAFAVDQLNIEHTKTLDSGCIEERAPFRLDAAQAHTSFVRTRAGTLIQLVQYDGHSLDRAPWDHGETALTLDNSTCDS
ncbi:VOC family protein [Rhodococcus globerulus]|uniref:VOC domain-containing protein n=1 Tax=Rhodococcus globerulus TaxID=33008 RepID=A0ABU4C3Z8_RHOGO|nr:hypothetical protein [Rhodococcus globerulus]MDV6271227.1 hypothetical protein [Rhodococcus globerulus]